MAKDPWTGKDTSKPDKTKPAAFTKATYDKTSIFGKSIHTEGRAASKESKKNERKR